MIQSLLRAMELLELLKRSQPQIFHRRTFRINRASAQHNPPDFADIL